MPLDRREFFIGAGLTFATSLLAGCESKVSTLKVGWQTPLATQGQIAAILQRTDLLKRNDIDAQFSAFSFGTPQMEAARAGAIDVAFVGDQPLINLICSGADWKILCRLFDTRVSLFRNLARPWSGPRGATFASPKGSVAHREVFFYQQAQGLNPETDVKNVFIDATEITGLLTRGSDWGGIDVIAIWEPLASKLAATAGVAKLFERTTLGVVGVDAAVASDADLVKHLRDSITAAWQDFLGNEAQGNNWYRALAGTQLSDAALGAISRIDRNFATKTPNIALSEKDKAELARSISWAVKFNQKLKPVKVSDILVP